MNVLIFKIFFNSILKILFIYLFEKEREQAQAGGNSGAEGEAD